MDRRRARCCRSTSTGWTSTKRSQLAHEVVRWSWPDHRFAERARSVVRTTGRPTRSRCIARPSRRRCGRRRRISAPIRPSTWSAACYRATACWPSMSGRTRTRSPANGPRTPRARFLITNGWSSMGFGLPAAIAAKLARPDLPVVCLIGDGCFQMTCGELATAKRQGLTIPCRRPRRQMARIDQGQAGTAPVPELRHRATARGISRPAGPLLRRPRRRRARPGGARGRAGKGALAADGPTVIEAVVDPDHYSETVFD